MSYAEDLLTDLDNAVKTMVLDAPPAILFSGGLDSGVVAAIASRYCRPTLYTVGIEGSYDLKAGKESAALLGLDWKGIVVNEAMLLDHIKRFSIATGLTDPLTISFELPVFIVGSIATEPSLMSGQGADELLGGYSRYLAMSEPERETCMSIDLENVLSKGASMERSIAALFGKKMLHPFLDPTVVQTARAIPCSEKIKDGVRKAVLRDVASLIGRDEIASRPKKAAQYGSGFMKVMKSNARRQGKTLGAFVTGLALEGQ